jgi:hypothetical protein
VVIVHLSPVRNGRLQYCLERCRCKDRYWDKEPIAPDFPGDLEKALFANWSINHD